MTIHAAARERAQAMLADHARVATFPADARTIAHDVLALLAELERDKARLVEARRAWDVMRPMLAHSNGAPFVAAFDAVDAALAATEETQP